MSSARNDPPAGTSRDPGFRGQICAFFGTTNVLVEERAGGMPRLDLHFESADPESLSRLKSELEKARVGVRLILSGPPAYTHAAAAAAAACGLLDEEVTMLSVDAGPRVIFCAHCRTSTETDQTVGSEVDCQGCDTTLAFSGHFSRRIGGYLGYSAHAEEET